jgi:hypothetical protein
MRKLTQKEANYQLGTPVGNCGICKYYQGHHHCSQVMGNNISPYGISSEYVADKNPFGKRLTANDIAQIKEMMRVREPNDVA